MASRGREKEMNVQVKLWLNFCSIKWLRAALHTTKKSGVFLQTLLNFELLNSPCFRRLIKSLNVISPFLHNIESGGNNKELLALSGVNRVVLAAGSFRTYGNLQEKLLPLCAAVGVPSTAI
jgi:hypothetical protein